MPVRSTNLWRWLAGTVVLKDAEGLLVLGEESTNGYAELGPGLKHPDARDPEGKVLPVSGLDQPVQHRVAEYPPPVPVFCRLRLHPLITLFQPGLRDLGRRMDEVRSNLDTPGSQEERNQQHQPPGE